MVTAASVSDKAGAKLLVIRLFDAFDTLKIMWADSGYDGKPLAAWIKAVAAITLEVLKRTAPHSFQFVRRRWVVERTFGWLMRYRRLARDYERRTENHEAMIYWATILVMTKRLARYGALGSAVQPARPGRPFRTRRQLPVRSLPDAAHRPALGPVTMGCHTVLRNEPLPGPRDRRAAPEPSLEKEYLEQRPLLQAADLDGVPAGAARLRAGVQAHVGWAQGDCVSFL